MRARVHNGRVSNTERRPDLRAGAGGPGEPELITPRQVPLGGLRAMAVRRTLPAQGRTLIGAWCFADHYGPDEVSQTGGMVVAPHPHTGLQTVSWLFSGEIEHRDSVGTHAIVRPGEMNLMTGGHGVSHSEVSTAQTTVLHGAQLWVALPRDARDTAPGFQHHVPDPVLTDGLEARVFLGSLLGDASPVQTHTPLLGAEITLQPGTRAVVEVDPTFEHGVLVDTGFLSVDGHDVDAAELLYLPTGSTALDLTNYLRPTRILLLGGPPFGESIVMWWNFVGRDHDEIVEFRTAWQAQITRDPTGQAPVVDDSQKVDSGRFGVVVGEHLPPLPAPPLPAGIRLRSRS
ncbi:pirin family protein [soil metagenome]